MSNVIQLPVPSMVRHPADVEPDAAQIAEVLSVGRSLLQQQLIASGREAERKLIIQIWRTRDATLKTKLQRHLSILRAYIRALEHKMSRNA